jgi:hypothetical protein
MLHSIGFKLQVKLQQIRLPSSSGGVMLGELFRARDFATEVGSSKLNSDVPIPGSKNVYTKTPGSCSSACAMAFLGGVERTLDPDSTLGFHVVSNPNVSEKISESLRPWSSSTSWRWESIRA